MDENNNLQKENGALKNIGPSFIGGDRYPLDDNINNNIEDDYKLKEDCHKLKNENNQLKEKLIN